jgi:hypothetical protein
MTSVAVNLEHQWKGDLDRDTQRFLDRVATGTRNGDESPAKGNHPSRYGLQPGSILVPCSSPS